MCGRPENGCADREPVSGLDTSGVVVVYDANSGPGIAEDRCICAVCTRYAVELWAKRVAKR